VSNKDQVLQQVMTELYPSKTPADVPKPDTEIDYHRLAVLFALCTRGDLLARTFPFGGQPNGAALFAANIGIDTGRISAAEIERLAPYREAFASVVRAWLELSEYTNPPCPKDARLAHVVQATKELQDI
jgi:hypothetical protein